MSAPDGPILLRAASGPGIGVGHVRRTRAVAQALRAAGHEPRFVVDDERTARALRAEGWRARTAAADALAATEDPAPRAVWLDGFRDWTPELQRVLTQGGRAVLVENRTARDLADHVVVPALHFVPDDWERAHPDRVHAGAAWIPLAEEVRAVAEDVGEGDGGGDGEGDDRDLDLLITFGGSDPHHLTERVLRLLANDPRSLAVTVGSHMGARIDTIAALAEALPDAELVVGASNLAPWMARSRAAVTAVGTTLYELAYLGVPAHILANYPEDRPALTWYATHGPHHPLGVAAYLADDDLAAGLAAGPSGPIPRPEGLGRGAERVAALLLD